MLQIGGRPVGAARRAHRRAVPLDARRLRRRRSGRARGALNLADPGSGFPTEVWANAADAEAERAARATLRRAPFDALVLDSRVEREQALRNDPISRGSLAMLAIAAAAAFLLALFALALTTLADLRDDRDALLDLESQGRHRARFAGSFASGSSSSALAGLVGGVVAGAILAGDRHRRRRGLCVRNVAGASARQRSTDPGLVLAGS